MSGRGAKPGGNSRGRGGKFKKYTRGGGHHFSRDLRPLDAAGNDDSGEESDEDESEDSEEDDGGPSKPAQDLTRDERRALKKAQKDAAIAKKKTASVQVGDLPSDADDSDDSADDMPANPNHSKEARKMVKSEPKPVEELTETIKKLSTKPIAGMSRKERETVEAAAAKERYRKLHEAGKTDEAKADLSRLRAIREKREAEAARKAAEREELEAQGSAKKAELDAREAKRREAALGKPAKKGRK